MTAIPKNIEREHILDAMRVIDLAGVPIKNQSKDYDVISEQKHYPPKYVILLANNNYTNNNKLTPNDFNSIDANRFLERLGFIVKEREDLQDEEPVATIIFPELNENLSIEELARIYRDIEEGKDVNPPIHIPFDCNVIPASIHGECKDTLVGIIIDKKDFERRMPEILAHHIRCMRQNKNKKIILTACYWDGKAWEITWKKPFKAVGGEVYLKMYDGLPVRIF